MKKISFSKTAMVIAIGLALASCNKNADESTTRADQAKLFTKDMMSENGTNPDEASVAENTGTATNAVTSPSQDGNDKHYLYTESNSSMINTIHVYEQKGNGSLQFQGSTASGGKGTGSPLGSQGALVFDKNNKWLFAVNAGSNSVSSFKVRNDGSLMLAHTTGTLGTRPVSVSIYGNLLYVLNNGSNNIHGFRIGNGGALTHIQGSTKSLSGTAVDAPQISFTPGGERLVVTEKATNIIGTFKIKNDGSVNPGIFTASVGATPFGFEFSRGQFMIVSNAAGGAAGAGSATSYITGNNGKPNDVNGAIPNFQAAPCWVAITKHGRYAFITNTATNNVSSYYVAPWGGLYLVESEATTTDMGPLDIVVAENNYYVYVLNSRSNTIGGYRRKFFGGLEFIGRVSGLPTPAAGLAIY